MHMKIDIRGKNAKNYAMTVLFVLYRHFITQLNLCTTSNLKSL